MDTDTLHLHMLAEARHEIKYWKRTSLFLFFVALGLLIFL